jgi:hypothetical protein
MVRGCVASQQHKCIAQPTLLSAALKMVLQNTTPAPPKFVTQDTHFPSKTTIGSMASTAPFYLCIHQVGSLPLRHCRLREARRSTATTDQATGACHFDRLHFSEARCCGPTFPIPRMAAGIENSVRCTAETSVAARHAVAQSLRQKARTRRKSAPRMLAPQPSDGTCPPPPAFEQVRASHGVVAQAEAVAREILHSRR